MSKRLIWVVVLAVLFTATISHGVATADPGSPPVPGATLTTGALQPIQLHRIGAAGTVSSASGSVAAAVAGQCWGFSGGGPVNSTTANGYNYNECSGDILGQYADVHIWYCIAVILNACFPSQDLGSIASRDIFGPGGFWTPETGTATRGGLTPGFSYMIFTTLTVSTPGGIYQGSSTSAIFSLPQ